KFRSGVELAEVRKSPVAQLDRYSGTSMEYQEVVSWDVGRVWGRPHGNLKEVSMRCAESAMYSHAVFKLTVKKTLMFQDKYISNALTMPYPDNDVLDQGDEVLLEVKSDSGSGLVVDGVITGCEF
ncbi:unnamed protein product, partial [marine sediment metagenome]